MGIAWGFGRVKMQGQTWKNKWLEWGGVWLKILAKGPSSTLIPPLSVAR